MVTVNQSGLPDAMLVLAIFASGVLGVMWIFILPVVGMLYMLGYLT